MTHIAQLRKITIQAGKLDEFVDAWRSGIVPLRLSHGYQIQAAWTIPERNEFCWILVYSGPEDWEAKEEAFYQALEKAHLDPDPVRYIVRVERWFIQPVSTVPKWMGDDGAKRSEG